MNNYQKLSTYFFLNKKSFILSSITGIFYNVLLVFIPIIQGKLIDLYETSNDKKYIIYFSISFLLLVIFIQINRYLKRFFVRDFANKMVLKQREIFFNNLLTYEIKDLDNKADLVSRAMSDINDTAEGVRKILTEVFDTLILFTGYTISLLVLDYKITLLSYIFIVVSIIVSRSIKGLIYKNVLISKKEASKNKKLTLSLIENEVYYRGFSASSRYLNKYEESSNKLRKTSIKASLLKDAGEPLYMSITLIGLFIVIYYSSLNVINGIWLIGTFSTFLSTYMLVSRKASKLGKLFNASASLSVSWDRIKPYLKNRKIKEFKVESSNNILEVNDLTFGFDETFKVSNVNFKANSGDLIVISGATHSGKTTLLAALSGIYSYTGSIKLNGMELKDVLNTKIDNFISYMESNTKIFSDTIKYNIALDKNIDISKYIKAVYLKEDIDNFNDRENEILNHSASTLSGGQEKRVGIARAISQNSALILLDDAFTAFDINMSLDIIDNIKKLCPSSVVIIVSNNNQILAKASKIIYLKDNTACVSNYDDLLKNNSFTQIIGGNI